MTSTTPEISFIGYATIDVNIAPKNSSVLPGGAAYFASLAASRIIKPVGLITRVGSDYNSSFLLNNVLSEGVKVIPDGKTAKSTLTYFSESDTTNRDISVEWGVAEFLIGDDIPREWLSFLKIIHIATMIPSQQYVILEYIKKCVPQAIISIDTDSFLLNNEQNIAIIRKSFEQSDIVFANRREYEILAETIEGRPEAIVKMDKDGAIYMQNGKIVASSRANDVKTVDVTGAGDIFAGTFLAYRHLEFSAQEALDRATNIATASITKKGITHLFKEEYGRK